MADNTRSYTTEQATVVEKILKHGPHEYYKILGIEKTSTETEIKKAYRKVSLKVHPDKNGHPKAAESFKRVAKAFEVLGDSNKRTIYDQTGTDPDSRGQPSASGASPFAGFQRGPGGGGMHGGGMPQAFPEDLFDILFGQGAGGMGGAGAGPTFMFGGPGGFTFTTNGGGAGFPFGDPFAQARATQQGQRRQQQQRQRQQRQEDNSLWGMLRQYLPMLMLLFIPIISNLFTESPEPFSLNKTPTYSNQRVSTKFHIPYYITPKQAETLEPAKLKKLDREAENAYVGVLRDKCSYERDQKEKAINQAYGWIFPDKEKLADAQSMKLVHCERLAQLGVGLL